MENAQPCPIDDARGAALDDLHFATALYTSTPVVEALLDRIGWPLGGARLLDPSVGDGSFLVSALGRLDCRPGSDVAGRLLGIELHPTAVAEARQRVAAYLAGRGWGEAEAVAAARRMVVQADFLSDGLPGGAGRFDVIAGNPPYLRWGNVPGFFRDIYEGFLPRYARGDLMHAFLDRCVEILPEDGVIAMVTADRWLFNETAAQLRETMGRRVGLCHVARLDAATSFYRPKLRRKGAPPRIHPVEVVLRPAARAGIPLTAKPISPDGADRAEAEFTLSDIAAVRLAPWLGPAGVFALEAADARALEGADLIPMFDTREIADPREDVLAPPSRFALLTRRDREPAGMVRDHLLANAARMPKRGGERPYWLPPESITLPLDQPCLVVPTIAGRLRVIKVPAGLLPTYHNLSAIYPRPGVTLAEIAEHLRSPEAQAWAAAHGAPLENGYFRVTTTTLKRLPVPAALAAKAKAAAMAAERLAA